MTGSVPTACNCPLSPFAQGPTLPLPVLPRSAWRAWLVSRHRARLHRMQRQLAGQRCAGVLIPTSQAKAVAQRCLDARHRRAHAAPQVRRPRAVRVKVRGVLPALHRRALLTTQQEAAARVALVGAWRSHAGTLRHHISGLTSGPEGGVWPQTAQSAAHTPTPFNSTLAM